MPLTKLKGRKLKLINIIYQSPSKITDWHDYIVIVYRDLILDRKETLVIEDPEMEIFVVKPEYRTFRKPRHMLSGDKLDCKVIKYKNLYMEIAKIAGPEYVEYYKTHTKKEAKNLFKYPYVLGADIDIETYYRYLWSKEISNDPTGLLTKSYFDIEVDQMYFEGSMAKHGEVPVNAFSLVDSDGKTVYEFLLNEPSNPLIQKFKDNIQEFYKELHEDFDDFYGELEYKIYIVDDEREMLLQIFSLIRIISPDFLGGWNIFGFDIEYIICRAKVLGIDPSELFNDKDFPNNSYYYFFNDTNSFDFANKRSYFKVSSRTYYNDMTITYASLRKSRGTVKRVNLGYVAQHELKDTKLDYSDAGNIRTLPYVDYHRFTKYSIKDSLLLMGLDKKVKDTDNLYLISMTNYVPIKDALKQTVVFRALMYGYTRSINMVIGHNVNFDVDTGGKYDENGDLIESEDDEDEDTFEGAINGDTMLNNANGVKLYNDIPSMFLYKLIIDFDFSAMYPNSIVAFNIFATCMIGKVIIEYTPENTYDKDMGKEYIEDVICGDVLHIGTKWHNLSSFEKLNEKMKNKLNNKRRLIA